MNRLAAPALLLLASFAAALDVPYLSGRVTDEARLLDTATAAALENTLKNYEAKTGRQIAVLTIPSLAGEPLEEFSLKVARTWKLGTKGRDDGVLILVAKDDRKVRIEVGYGLEGAVPDALAGRIIRETMVPRFRAGLFADGVREGTDAVIAALDGRLPASTPGSFPTPVRPMEALTFVDFLCMALGVFFLWLDWVEVQTEGADLSVFFNGAIFIPLWFSPLVKIWGLPAVVAAFLVHVLGFLIGKLLMNETAWGARRLKKRTGSHGHDAIFFGTGGGGSSGGGWSSGGGFSGGGGSFGGGGASGSW